MAWTKSPQSLVDLFSACLPDRPGLERRQMFGYPAAFVNGNMFAGLFQDGAMARLPPTARAALEAEFDARPFEPMPGRPMRAYLALPQDILDDEDRLTALLAEAFVFTSAMPPKIKAPRKVKPPSPRS
jgi:TfoX/Sxy family transcriptional regulator of competence genes